MARKPIALLFLLCVPLFFYARESRAQWGNFNVGPSTGWSNQTYGSSFVAGNYWQGSGVWGSGQLGSGNCSTCLPPPCPRFLPPPPPPPPPRCPPWNSGNFFGWGSGIASANNYGGLNGLPYGSSTLGAYSGVTGGIGAFRASSGHARRR